MKEKRYAIAYQYAAGKWVMRRRVYKTLRIARIQAHGFDKTKITIAEFEVEEIQEQEENQ